MKAVAVAARAFRLYAVALGVAAALIVAAFVDDDAPDDGAGWLGLAVVAGVVAAPAVLVFLFSAALASLAAFPERVRGAPGDLRGHGLEAQRIFGRRGFGSLLLLPFRLLRLGAGTRETLMPYAPLLPLASVAFLAATGLAALAGLGVLLLGLFALGDLAG